MKYETDRQHSAAIDWLILQPSFVILHPSKMRTPFEGAHGFGEVRILENPGDLFEDAQPFARCAPETPHLRTARFAKLRRGSLVSDSTFPGRRVSAADAA